MPRKPTGRPRGRQLGSGALGLGTQDKHDRLTLRIPHDLYTRLEAFAEGRAYTRGTPHLARCVRDAIEHYLACPNKRQTSSVPPLPVDTWQTSNGTQEEEDIIRQTSNCIEGQGDTRRQTSKVPATSLAALEHDKWQTLNVPEHYTTELEHDTRQTLNTARPVQLDAADLDARPPASVAIAREPAYNPMTDVLGALCVNGHDYQGTGQSPRRQSDGECRQCRIDRNTAYKARKRQAAPVA